MDDIAIIMRNLDGDTVSLTQVDELQRITVYICAYCDTAYDLKVDSDRCCSQYKAERYEGIRCYVCEAQYDDLDDARDCCRPSTAVIHYLCPDCECAYETEREAQRCCE